MSPHVADPGRKEVLVLYPGTVRKCGSRKKRKEKKMVGNTGEHAIFL